MVQDNEPTRNRAWQCGEESLDGGTSEWGTTLCR
jgi:hypothetical protein